MEKGQASVEFLFAFAATIMLISIISAALLSHKASLEEKEEEVEKIAAVESAARTIEAALSTGMDLEFDFSKENISYTAEEDRFLVSYKGEVIEVKGVFAYEDSEPV
jgi:hypothetical protein